MKNNKTTGNVETKSTVDTDEMAERIPCLGIAVTRCVRGLSAAGFTIADIKAIVKASGSPISERLIYSQYRYGKRIELSAAQLADTKRIAGEAAAAKVKADAIAAAAKAKADAVVAKAAAQAAKAAKAAAKVKPQVEAEAVAA